MPKVELIYDRDCPNVAHARAELLRGFAQAGVPARWQEWERSAAESPPYASQYGSPTILLDGEDVAPMQDMQGAGCCRLYMGEGTAGGSPSADHIAQRLRATGLPQSASGGWKTTWAVLPGAGVALLPKLACPACWPAYAALVSSLGLGFLVESQYLLAVIAGFLLLALAALGWRARSRRGYGPLLLGIAAAAAIIAGKFWLEANAVVWGGATLLAVASIWNAWPRRAACSECVAPPAG
jgi:hypothetical protein